MENNKTTAPTVPVITIDGASGTGKGIVMQWVAKELGWNLLDSGALYRVLALAAQKHQISLEDEAALTHQALHLDVQFVEGESGDTPQILLENQDVTDIIRTEKIGNAASIVGTWPAVRIALLDRQKAFRTEPGLVTDGRDMGTVVFPDAILKIFLTASPEERATRRYKQLKAKGIHVNLEELVEELSKRDQRDRNRAVAPLKPADDAICIDTDKLTIEQVVGRIMQEVKTLL
ncbi:MAG: (d)CMP kinase [Gammaproteobacteria bacterium]|nr:(d)CMP kinase [Gammaproteobacteria bacterium]